MYPKHILSPELQKALSGQGACRMLHGHTSEVVALAQVRENGTRRVEHRDPERDAESVYEIPSALFATRNKAEIRGAMQTWYSAFESMCSPDLSSQKLLWVDPLRIWMEARDWLSDETASYYTLLGIRTGLDEVITVVEVNPPNGGLPNNRRQGLAAYDARNDYWILHAGEMHVDGKRVHISDLLDADLPPALVDLGDGRKLPYYPVARLGASSEQIVRDTKRFVNCCLRVRAGTEGGPLAAETQRSAQSLEESLSLTRIPAQPEKVIDPEHPRIQRALVAELKLRHLDVSRDRVGSLGPDLYTIGGPSHFLFEIKTSCGASDYLKGVGQLLVYESALKRSFQKFLVVPTGLGKVAVSILAGLRIGVIEFSQHGSSYAFVFPEDFPTFKQ
ncbi:hypothetical protein [Ensifer sp. Root278]|uniref:hypothetical protein n=1 Tax=Ensifer sp. Root278 TaxID=1736509 RepID=UPI000709796D|nr:hypothetical protein [Ensifer sp. Root278]